MKKSLFLMGFLLLSLSSFGQKKLVIVADGMAEIKGSLLVVVFNSDSTFLKKPVFATKANIHADTEEVVTSLPEGEYAIFLFQDSNENGKMDTREFGIPIEKYGFSNNVVGKMGPPSFKETCFALEKDIVVRITLR